MSKGTSRVLLICLTTAYLCTMIYQCTNDKSITPRCRDSVLVNDRGVTEFYCHPDARLDLGGTQPACICDRPEATPEEQ